MGKFTLSGAALLRHYGEMSLLVQDPYSYRPRVSTRLLVWTLVLCTLLGLVLRWPFLTRVALHSDEYLTLYRSMLIAQGDLFLSADPSQKPPLYYFVIAAVFRLFGVQREYGLSLGVLCSMALIPATGLLAACVTRSLLAALLSALLIALSPFHVAFFATGFLDPPMILLGVLGLSLAALGKTGWAGFFCGAAIAVKQQGLLFAPLALWFLMYPRPTRSTLILFTAPLLGWLVSIWIWAVAVQRGGFTRMPYFVSGQLASESAQIGGSFVVNPFTEGWIVLGERLLDWGRFISLFFGPASLGLFAVALAILVLYRGWMIVATRSASLLVSALLVIALLTVVRFRIVDRYVFLLLPLAAVLIGSELARWTMHQKRAYSVLLITLLGLNGLYGVVSVRENARVIPTSAGARERLIGAFTEGVPLTFATIRYLEHTYGPETEVYVHGALLPPAQVELRSFRFVRSVLGPLRFLEKDEASIASKLRPQVSPRIPLRILLWKTNDERRLKVLTAKLERGGYDLIAARRTAEVDPRLSVYSIVARSAA